MSTVTAAISVAAVLVTLPIGMGSASAAGDPVHDRLMAPYLTGPSKALVDGAAIDTSVDRLLVIAQGRDISTTRKVDPREATFDDKVAMFANRGIPLNGINVYNWTQQVSPVVANNRYATWSQLGHLVRDVGGSLSSEGYNHDSLTEMSATDQWRDTCGVLDDYEARGFNASSMYAYAGGHLIDTYQRDLVSKCYAFGRSYVGRPNTMARMASPWVLNVWSLNGGCTDKTTGCFGTTSPQRYQDVAKLRASLTPGKGQVSVLQIYHLVVGTGPTWDCDSAVHQTSTTETYCMSDVAAFVDGLPSDVKVTTLDDLAQAYGRGPDQLPGLSLTDWLRSKPKP